MKKALSLLVLIITVVMVLSLAGCGADAPATPETPEEPGQVEQPTPEEPLKVALLLNGTLGDKSFFDSADRGLQMAKEEYGDSLEYTTVEMTTDETKWLPTLYDYADDPEWDIIIVGTWQMAEPLMEVAPQYPDKKFFIFDQDLDFSTGEVDNVYSIMYKQNEGSFLAGAVAARLSETKIIGFLGGSENPIINDFLIGYIEGAKYIEPDIKVVISYVGNFFDTPKGKDLALSQYQQNGVDVGFNVAGLAGLGQIDAAREVGKLAIGVDSDQALIFGEPTANFIPTSMLKNVDLSILRAIGLHLEGKLPYGSVETLGIAENGVGLADNEYYQKLVPEEVREEVEELSQMILNGEIQVDNSFGKSNEEIQAIKDSVK